MGNELIEWVETDINTSAALVKLCLQSTEILNNEKVVNLFSILMDKEKQHLHILELIKQRGWREAQNKAENINLSIDGLINFTTEDVTALVSSYDEQDSLNNALEAGYTACAFYEQLNGIASEENQRTLIQWLLENRLERCKNIARIIALVRISLLDLSEKYNIPYLPFAECPVDSKALKLFPEQLVHRFNVFPLSADGGTLRLAISNPMDFFSLDSIEDMTGYQIEPVIVNREEILAAIEREYGAELKAEKNIDELVQEELLKERHRENLQSDKKKETRQEKLDSPAVKFVNLLLEEAIQYKASDLHIEPHESGVDVRMRVDGRLHHMTAPTKSMLPAIVSRIKIMAGLDIGIHRLPQDGHFMSENRNLDIRASLLPTAFGEKVVLRLLDKTKLVRGLNELGFNSGQLRIFVRSLNCPQGMILVTGPTGSGKTTTLYSGLHYLCDEEKNIVTIEDPVEYFMPYKKACINQVQVHHTVGLNFAAALRSILRQDPDIVMIGEIRDLETAQLAIRAALTGHLVLSTIHTNNALATITRLEDMGIKTYLLGSSLELIIAQRLVRRICEHCKEEYEENAELLRDLNIPQGTTLYRGRGCKACMHTGYAGRVAIYEMLPVNTRLAGAISRNIAEDELISLAKEQGMITLRESGVRKIEAGITTAEEILARTIEDK